MSLHVTDGHLAGAAGDSGPARSCGTGSRDTTLGFPRHGGLRGMHDGQVPEIVVDGRIERRPAAAISRRTLWVTLGTLVPAATAVAALGLWPMWHTAVPVALVTLALFAALFAAGVVLMAEPGQAAAGIAMIVSAAMLIISWANEWRAGPLPLVSIVVGNLWLLGVAWALYRYPNRRLARGDRWMFTGVLAWFVATSWLLVFLSRPEWHQYPPYWWPTLFSNLTVYRTAARAVDAAPDRNLQLSFRRAAKLEARRLPLLVFQLSRLAYLSEMCKLNSLFRLT